MSPDRGEPILALAPMQDVTDLAFWRLMTEIAGGSGADVYFTEYFRVYETSRLDKAILRSITENPTGRPVIAQMIGNDIAALVRTARELQQHDVAAIDLNLGCPAPVVYRKCAGGGLLRDPARVDGILGALREAVEIPFTVKTRLGFDSPAVFDDLLPIFARHSLDLLTVHGRTVLEMYRSEVHYDFIARAVEAMPGPVLANGNIDSARTALRVLRETRARGLMIGRGAIRNPWIFGQIRDLLRGDSLSLPTGRDVLAYVRALYSSTFPPGGTEKLQVQKMKKYLNFLGAGVEPTGRFLHDIRRVEAEAELFRVCETFLDHPERMALEAFPASASA
ncbi:MAG: tRNA-dihydrouridine synthase family protein [Terrimicrobiaceae bacterium]|nr:tRNA-dihydrouridine synthase family protein [Terrimicrobiaceae bacterium]